MSVSLKPDRTSFEAEVARRGITRLVHFTPTINLISIYEQGALLSREQLKRLVMEYPELHLGDYVEINDRLRLDNLNDYLNLSIQHPNHWLFQKFRDSCRNWCNSWCVIACKPECLWYVDTMFSIGNAASSISKQHGVNGQYKTFCSLFQDKVVAGNIYSQRILTRINLADCHPTDAQAEVLVKGRIPIDCITEVFFETQEEASRSHAAIVVSVKTPLAPFNVNPQIFGGQRTNG
jgi:hypothetical protein